MIMDHYLKIFTWQSGNLVLALTVNVDLPQYGCSGQCLAPWNGTVQTADVAVVAAIVDIGLAVD
jgi:hypothetical protein